MTNSEFLLYKTIDNKVSINVQIKDETVWLTQEQMAELFSKSKPTINEHIKNIYTEKELSEEATMRKFGNSEFSQCIILLQFSFIINVNYMLVNS